MVSGETVGRGHLVVVFGRTSNKTHKARRAFVGGSPVSCLSRSALEARSSAPSTAGKAAMRCCLSPSGVEEASMASVRVFLVAGQFVGLTR